MYGASDVRVETVPDPVISESTDAIVRVTSACICGSDLWPYQQMEPTPGGRRMGHEFIGIIEDAGANVRTVKKGDLVVAPFAWSDGTCEFCRRGLQTSCLHGGFWGGELDGGQGEAVRVPLADGTLVKLPVGRDHALMPSLLTRGEEAVERVGVPQQETMPASIPTFFANVTIAGGPAPVRAYIEELMPDILDGRIEPGRVFDRTVGLDEVPDGYQAMADRKALKVLVTP